MQTRDQDENSGLDLKYEVMKRWHDKSKLRPRRRVEGLHVGQGILLAARS